MQKKILVGHCFEEYLKKQQMVILKCVSIPNYLAEIISDSLKVNSLLIELSLSRCHISHENIAMLAEAIKVNITLKIIDISHNQITDDSALFISDGLKINKHCMI